MGRTIDLSQTPLPFKPLHSFRLFGVGKPQGISPCLGFPGQPHINLERASNVANRAITVGHGSDVSNYIAAHPLRVRRGAVGQRRKVDLLDPVQDIVIIGDDGPVLPRAADDVAATVPPLLLYARLNN